MSTDRVDGAARRVVSVVRSPALREGVLLPVAVIVIALGFGAVLLAIQSVPVLEAYQAVLRGSFGSVRALVSTATTATPLILIALGVALAFRAGLITIGAEGQFLIGAVAAVAVVTAPALSWMPGPTRLVVGLVVAAAAGGLWSMVSGVLSARFGASVVITSLLLNYVAQAVVAWATRVGIPDPDAFTPQTRGVGEAALPDLPGTTLHVGFFIALAAAAAMWAVLHRGRMGLRVGVMGSGGDVLQATEANSGRYAVLILVIAGGAAGLAGFVEVAGVTERITGAFSGGVGFTAIMVALLGRLHPVGIVLASIAMSALDVGFASASRSLRIPTTTVEIIQAVSILLFVVGAALLQRRKEAR